MSKIEPQPPPGYNTAPPGYNTAPPGYNTAPPVYNIAPPVGFVIPNQLQYGPKPQHIICPFCSTSVKTTTNLKAKSSTHLWAVGLCLCLCWICCCIPYCVNSCNNVNHTCPNCDRFLGTYSS